VRQRVGFTSGSVFFQSEDCALSDEVRGGMGWAPLCGH
jgi:hypothetical protein